MSSSIRKRLTYANVFATLALVFAMSGGALAATHYLITSTKQIKPSVLASLKGRAGSPGSAGAAGPAGPGGPAGPKGENGTAGKNGENGQPGVKGETGPTGPAGPKGAKGEEGEPGPQGATGPEGSPWTHEGKLPSGASETGQWLLEATVTEEKLRSTVISFGVPLKEGEVTTPHFIAPKATPPPGCKGSVAAPVAEPGNLCVFENENLNANASFLIFVNAANDGFEEVGTTGAIVAFESKEAGEMIAGGTWAVTAK